MMSTPAYTSGYEQSSSSAAYPQSTYKTPQELTPELAATMEMVVAFTQSADSNKASPVYQQLHENAVWDTPLLLVKGKNHIRVLNAAYNWMFGPIVMEPQVVRITVPNEKVAELDFESLLHWAPARHLWFPISYFMPEDVPLHGTTSICVRERSDFLSDIKLRINNWPVFPSVVRRVNGWVLGYTAALAEPLVHPLVHYFNLGLVKTAETVEQVVVPYTPQPVLSAVKGVTEKMKETAGVAVPSSTATDLLGGTDPALTMAPASSPYSGGPGIYGTGI